MSRPRCFGAVVAMCVLPMVPGAQIAAAQSVPPLDAAAWPRVFYDSQQRAAIVRNRLPPALREVQAAPVIDPDTLPPPMFTLDGIALGQRGASATINGKWYRTGDKIFDWVVKIEANQVVLSGVDVPILRIKPGQSVRIDNGAVSESVPKRAIKLGASVPGAITARPSAIKPEKTLTHD